MYPMSRKTLITVASVPCSIPYLYEDAFQWYESFDQLGELLTRPNPTPAMEVLDKVIDYLTRSTSNDGCGWSLGRIHFFGFAQGGSVAAEFSLRRWKKITSRNQNIDDTSRLASIVSIEGPLLEYPTVKSQCPTPFFFFHRTRTHNSSDLSAIRKAYSDVKDARMSGDTGMPRNKEEWGPIIQFWGRVLSSRMPDIEGVHPVLSGGPSLPGKSVP
jgi:hypothetical protein